MSEIRARTTVITSANSEKNKMTRPFLPVAGLGMHFSYLEARESWNSILGTQDGSEREHW